MSRSRFQSLSLCPVADRHTGIDPVSDITARSDWPGTTDGIGAKSWLAVVATAKLGSAKAASTALLVLHAIWSALGIKSEAAFVGRNAREEWLPGARGALVPP